MNKNTIKITIMILSFLISTLTVANIFADTKAENTELARINSVLNAVYPLIDAAQQKANPNTRIKFHYEWLKQDIQKIQAGITQKINNAPIEPREIAPLKGNFLTQQNNRKDGGFE